MQGEGGEEESHQIEAQQKLEKSQERHKDTSPLRYAAKRHFTEPESLTELCTQSTIETYIE